MKPASRDNYTAPPDEAIESDADMSDNDSGSNQGGTAPKTVDVSGAAGQLPTVCAGPIVRADDDLKSVEPELLKYTTGSSVKVKITDLLPCLDEWQCDRATSKLRVKAMKSNIKSEPCILVDGNPFAVVALASREQYNRLGEITQFDRVCIGGRHRHQACLEIVQEDPEFFIRVKNKFGFDLDMVPAIVYLHDPNDSETIPADKIPFAAASNNYNNPGSEPPTFMDKLWFAVSQIHSIVNSKIPVEPWTEITPNISGKQQTVWRSRIVDLYSPYTKSKGAAGGKKIRKASGLEPLLSLAKRPQNVLELLHELDEKLQEREYEALGDQDTRRDMINNYHAGSDGWTGLDDGTVVKTLREALTNLEKNFETKAILGKSEGGIVYNTKMVKLRLRLVDFMCRQVGLFSFRALQRDYPEHTKFSLLDSLCQSEKNSKSGLVPLELKRHEIPTTWKEHAAAAQQWKNRAEGYGDDVGRLPEEEAISVVKYSTKSLSELNKAEVASALGVLETRTFEGIQLVVARATDSDSAQDQIAGIINLMRSLKFKGYYNLLFLGSEAALRSLRTYLTSCDKIITYVQEIGFFFVSSQGSNKNAFKLRNPLVPYLLAHYAEDNKLCATNLNLEKCDADCNVFQAESNMAAYGKLIGWTAFAQSWVLDLTEESHVAVACKRSGRNVLVCGSEDSVASIRDRLLSVQPLSKEAPSTSTSVSAGEGTGKRAATTVSDGTATKKKAKVLVECNKENS